MTMYLIVSDLTKVVGTSEPLSATLLYETEPLRGYDLNFLINGVSYTRTTDYYGTARLNINLPVGEYECTVSFPGDIDYDSVSETVTVIVIDKYISNVSASDYGKGYLEKGQLKAKLEGNGSVLADKTLVFTVNGISYERVTGSDGYAGLNINLPVGVYSTKIEFFGDDYYKPSTRMVNVSVLNDTRLVGADIRKLQSEKMQYRVTLTDCYGNVMPNINLNIRVNGVTYVRTTDNNGTAGLNINLPAGTYDITTSYTGTGEYLSSTCKNTVVVTPDIQNVTPSENGVSTPYNRGFMESRIYTSLYTYEGNKKGNYGFITTDFEKYEDLEKYRINFTSYEITETDPRVKTAKFTTSKYMDLTAGQRFVYITSPYHENFGGKILSVDYDKNTGLYTYQCQDGRRNYQDKRRLKIGSGAGLTIYDVIEASLITPYYTGTGSINMPITDEQRNNYPISLSGLRPIDEYDIKLSPGIAKQNVFKRQADSMLGYDTLMDRIMNLAHTGQSPTDVYFTPDLVCHIDPVDIDQWTKTGLRLVHSDLVQYKYGFDTTNIITGVRVKGDASSKVKYYDDWNELIFYFGPNSTMIDAVTTTSSSGTTSTSNSSSSGSSGSSIMSGKKTFVVGADNYDDGRSNIESQWINKVISALQAKGHTCINVGVGPSAVTRYGNKSASKGKIGVFIVNGSDAGMYTDFKEGLRRGYYHYDHMIAVMASNVATTDNWLTCKGMANSKLVRAHDDNYSPGTPEAVGYTAKQYFQKYSKYISYVCGPLGCTFDTVVNNLVNGNFGSDGASTTSVTTTNTTSSTSNTTVSEIKTYEKALEEVSKSVRDLLSFEIKIPLNNTLFKSLHTNQMLWTELPKDFKLGNLDKIFRIMGAWKQNRGVSYQENRWYVEKIVTKMDSNGLFATLTLNPFPSPYSSYANAVTGYVDAYNQAFNSSSNVTSSAGTTFITNTTSADYGTTIQGYVNKWTTGKGSELEKAKAIHEGLKAYGIKYKYYGDFKAGNAEQCLKAANTQGLNCGDTALLTTACMKAAGLDAYIGFRCDHAHYFTVILINGVKYYSDLTWSTGSFSKRAWNVVWQNDTCHSKYSNQGVVR